MTARLLAAAATAAAASLLQLPTATAIPNPEDYVNTLGGTDSRYDFSRGNVLPVVSTPWGFNGWAPLTDNGDGSWWFHPYDKRYFGVRLTHQPSPWIGDYGQLRIAASITDPGHSDSWQYSGYDAGASAWSPYYHNATLIAYGNGNGQFTTVELTSTSHAAVLRVKFPPLSTGELSSGFNQTRRVLLALNSFGMDTVAVDTSTVPGLPIIRGLTRANNGGVSSNFAHYFYATVETPAAGGAGKGARILSAASTFDSQNPFAYVDFDPTDASSEEVIVRIGTSFISQAQAELNLVQELGGLSSSSSPAAADFDTVMQQSKAEWNAVLGGFNVTDLGAGLSPQQQADRLQVTYTLLYRASLFPRFLSEISSNGTEMHWSPFDPAGGVWPGPLVTDSGFWDAYRTVYPFLSLTNPAILGRMMQGWVNSYKEGGWVPKWASPGPRNSMVGTMQDVSLADAIVKKIPGFDVQSAYAAIRKDAFVVPPAGNTAVGRSCLQAYLQNGYIPEGAASVAGQCYENVARTLNYQLSDWAIAQAATTLGYTADAQLLAARAQNYSKIFEPSTGFFRARWPNGTWVEPFGEGEQGAKGIGRGKGQWEGGRVLQQMCCLLWHKASD